MIHLIEPNHLSGFKREAKRITDMGLEITIYTKYNEGRKPKWNYICKNKDCKDIYERVNRLKDYKYCTCSKCNYSLKEIKLSE